ncbi:MAG: hypothetical protein GY851_05260 [bacterium]|nr:hypothetical protein [bacterium]
MIAEMARLEIVCMRDVLPEVVIFVQEAGLLHLEETPLAVERAPGYLHRMHLTDEQRAEREAAEQLARMLQETAPLLSVAPDQDAVADAVHQLRDKGPGHWRRAARGWSRDVRSLTRRKLNVADNLELLGSLRKTLDAVAPLLGETNVVLGKNARAFALKGDVANVVERLGERVREDVGPEARLLTRRTGRNAVVGIVTYPEELDQSVEFLLREEHIAPVELPDRSIQGGTFQEVIASVAAIIEEHGARVGEIQAELDQVSSKIGPPLRAMERLVADRMAQLDAIRQFAESRLVAVLSGWIPSADADGFAAQIKDRFPGQVAAEQLPVERVERARIPTLLKNHPVFQPFEVLLTLFRPPTYGSFDPSMLVGVFFVLFYGFILGDVAYGAAVVAVALWLRKKFSGQPAVRAAGMVGCYMGVSSMVFGVLYGEYAGDLGHRLAGLQPVWFHRGHDAMTLLVVAIAAGAVHIVLSLVVGIREAFRHHSIRHALEQLGLMMGLFGVGIGVAAYSGHFPLGAWAGTATALTLLAGCAGLLVYTSGAMAPVQMMEVMSLVTNVLSYSRLMALGIASLALADVANQLARESGSLIIGVPLALVLHALNVCIGMFSPTLHSLRLNYVESLPKFYRPEGRRYVPFKKEAGQ